MIIVYTPPGGEPEHYDATSLKVSEASIVQRTIDMKWQDILKALGDDDLDAMRGIVWVYKKRSTPSLRYGDFDPGVADMTTRMDMRETEAYLDNYLAASGTEADLPLEAVREILLSHLPDVSIDPERARQLIAEKTDPKEDQAPADHSPQPEPASEAPSPSLTSSEPETNASDSSPTSSTSLPQPSMT